MIYSHYNTHNGLVFLPVVLGFEQLGTQVYWTIAGDLVPREAPICSLGYALVERCSASPGTFVITQLQIPNGSLESRQYSAPYRRFLTLRLLLNYTYEM